MKPQKPSTTWPQVAAAAVLVLVSVTALVKLSDTQQGGTERHERAGLRAVCSAVMPDGVPAVRRPEADGTCPKGWTEL